MTRKLILAVFFVFSASITVAQDITGKWYGVLKVGGSQLRLVFNVLKKGDGYASTMDSPDQKAKDIPVDSTTWAENTVVFKLPRLTITYFGKLDSGKIKGTFIQGGTQVPLVLERGEIAPVTRKRPQEPQVPYPYREEDVTFANNVAGITLGGTLTMPANGTKFPTVVLITGSGAQNRNSEVFGHKPFLVIADYLTRQGIAVLRFDDRGVGKSTGNHAAATSADFATDVKAAIAYLKTRAEVADIGLIGHSEGGLIAPLVASTSNEVKFIVMLAGPGLRGDRIMLLQQQLIGKAEGESKEALARRKEVFSKLFDIIMKQQNSDLLQKEMYQYLETVAIDTINPVKPANLSNSQFVDISIRQLATPWMLNFLRYDPTPALMKVKCPVLALNGSLDLQVPPAENLASIKAALAQGGNRQATIKELAGLNHLFQETKTGSPNEYGDIEQTFSPVALQEVLSWIKSVTKM
jgi:fermentation-respiration switch protein FrsA (DUF1100 family)